MKTVKVETFADGVLVCEYSANFFNMDLLDASGETAEAEFEDLSCGFFFNTTESLGASHGIMMRQLLYGAVAKYRFYGKVCMGYHTNDAFADKNGSADATFLGCLADNVMSNTCGVVVRNCVTMSLVFDIIKPVQPGCDIVCDSVLGLEHSDTMLTRGTILSSCGVAETYSGTYLLV